MLRISNVMYVIWYRKKIDLEFGIYTSLRCNNIYICMHSVSRTNRLSSLCRWLVATIKKVVRYHFIKFVTRDSIEINIPHLFSAYAKNMVFCWEAVLIFQNEWVS